MTTIVTTQAIDCIQEASEGDLRAVVLALCKDARTEKRVLTRLDKLNKLRNTQTSLDTTNPGTKRKASEAIFICVRCNEAFSEENNHSKACTYHHGMFLGPRGVQFSTGALLFHRHSKVRYLTGTTNITGNLDINYDHDDTWADWDENCHGTMDTDENREEWPEGFVWDCCEKDGTAPGCTKGHRYAVEGKRVRMTGADASLSNENDEEAESENYDEGNDDDLRGSIISDGSPLKLEEGLLRTYQSLSLNIGRTLLYGPLAKKCPVTSCCNLNKAD